jgi:hypothetical protein
MPKNSKPKQPIQGYNPYIHGTTSATLCLMAKTDFQLMPMLKMIDDYQVAPMVGELTQGGYKFPGSKLVQEEVIGATSFGKLQTGRFNLRTITAGYTRFNSPKTDEILQNLKDELTNSLAEGFSNINLLLIHFTRARQMHQSFDEIITKDELDTLKQH